MRKPSDRILQAAYHLFANKGYHGTSTKEIARRARVSEATIFRQFKDKHGVAAAVAKRSEAWLRDSKQTRLVEPEDFKLAAGMFLRWFSHHLTLDFMRVHLIFALRVPDVINRDTPPAFEALIQRIEREHAKGGSACADAVTCARGLAYCVLGARLASLLWDQPELSRHDINDCLNIWLYGALPR